MRRKRQLTTFSLSFLDIMCCGFGAVVLVFLIIDHASDAHSQEVNRNLLAEINFLEDDVSEGEEGLVRLRNTLSAVDQQFLQARGMANRIRQSSENYRDRLDKISHLFNEDRDQVDFLTSDIQNLEKKVQQLREEKEKNKGRNARSFLGDGDRQYLTGLRLGGERVLILLDSSASMLDSRIVNIVRLRNMSKVIKRNAEKWKRSVATVQWLVAQLPTKSQYQIYSFNNHVSPLISGSMDQWLEVADAAQLEDAVNAVKQLVPSGGTSLENVFLSILDLSPLPDSIFLLTDGLPTQGAGFR